jgi:aldehyde dehydrogenase (NAD+)
MTDGHEVRGEARLLIDGKLVESSTGAAFDNIDPTTEEVLGDTADGTAQDMQSAVAAARRAFDDTDWSTNHEFRRRCLEQFHAACAAHIEDLRAVTVGEVGSPIALTYANQVDLPIDDLGYWVDQPVRYEYETGWWGPSRPGTSRST